MELPAVNSKTIDESRQPLIIRMLPSAEPMSKVSIITDKALTKPIGQRPAMLKTGRQRKKSAVRVRGGDFRARTEKRRIYFCSISAELEVEAVMEDLKTTAPPGWVCTMYTNVLHMYFNGPDKVKAEREDFAMQSSLYHQQSLLDRQDSYQSTQGEQGEEGEHDHGEAHQEEHNYLSGSDLEDSGIHRRRYRTSSQESVSHTKYSPEQSKSRQSQRESPDDTRFYIQGVGDSDVHFSRSEREHEREREGDEQNLWSANSRECFVFDFGSVVFWGFTEQEEREFLHFMRHFMSADPLPTEEFTESEDDMAFVVLNEKFALGNAQPRPEAQREIWVENDVFTISQNTSPRQRLALSFGQAQSSVLAVFEARIQAMVEEYRYIPETYASHGKLRLTARQLGNMIGQVFVVRHDVNLHTEILDTPDWFWNQRDVEDLYKLVSNYLEMDGRTEILNKRLDMLYQLLSMLQQQQENSHNNKLEWIVIILIGMSIVVEVVQVLGKIYGWWS